MSPLHRFGQHSIELEEETRFILFTPRGDLLPDDMRFVFDQIEGWLAPDEPMFQILNLTEAGDIPAPARVVFAEAVGRMMRPIRVATLGPNFGAIVRGNLLFTAMRVIGKDLTGRWVDDEASAREWLLKQRAKLAA